MIYMSDSNNIEFRFVDIQILSKSLHYIPQAHEEFSFFYGINSEAKVRPEVGLVVILITVNVLSDKEQSLATLNSVCSFEIVEFEKNIKQKEDGKYFVPDDLEELFKQVSISTMRGIMYSELKGTYLNNAIMPIIFPNNSRNANGSTSLKDILENK